MEEIKENKNMKDSSTISSFQRTNKLIQTSTTPN